jgi:methylthioribose-1-phosphate isomerase
MKRVSSMGEVRDSVRALIWENEVLQVLDQRLLPEKIVFNSCSTVVEVAESIRSMQVRGAPAIGIAAAYGVVLAAKQRLQSSGQQWREAIESDLTLLAQARPTAVNLFWAIERMRKTLRSAGNNPLNALAEEARTIHEEDVRANLAMGDYGAKYLEGALGALTHCNTGALATGGFGTALGVIRASHSKGLKYIYATETRPWLQGARLTVWELSQDAIPATLIADSAAAFLMKSGKVQWVVVGADRIAANGDVANKIGTYALAVAAKHHGVRFMVVAPTSTVDFDTPDGAHIEIEEREPGELLKGKLAEAGSGINVWNPVFDVTPAELIDVIVTEKGPVEAPSLINMKKALL